MLIDYLYAYPNIVLRYFAGDIQIYFESDALYLIIKGVTKRVAGYFHLSASYNRKKKHNQQNAPIHTECATLKKCRLFNNKSSIWGFIS